MSNPDNQWSKPSLDAEALWTVQEVAQYLRLEPETVRAMSRDGKLPAIKVGRVWRYQKEQIKDWLQRSFSTSHY